MRITVRDTPAVTQLLLAKRRGSLTTENEGRDGRRLDDPVKEEEVLSKGGGIR